MQYCIFKREFKQFRYLNKQSTFHMTDCFVRYLTRQILFQKYDIAKTKNYECSRILKSLS